MAVDSGNGSVVRPSEIVNDQHDVKCKYKYNVSQVSEVSRNLTKPARDLR